MKLLVITLVFAISNGFVIEVDKERLQQMLKDEYGSIFNKVIMVGPVMQKVRFGIGSKLPPARNSASNSLKDSDLKRSKSFFTMKWKGGIQNDGNHNLQSVLDDKSQ